MKKIKFTVATWNVRTMLDKETRPERRTAMIAKEIERYKIDITALQETRLKHKAISEKMNTLSSGLVRLTADGMLELLLQF